MRPETGPPPRGPGRFWIGAGGQWAVHAPGKDRMAGMVRSSKISRQGIWTGAPQGSPGNGAGGLRGKQRGKNQVECQEGLLCCIIKVG